MFPNWGYWDPPGTESHKPEQDSLGAGMDQGVNQQQTQEWTETPGVNLLVRAGKVTKMGLGAAGGDHSQFGKEHSKGKRPIGMKTAITALWCLLGMGSACLGLWLWHPHPVSLSDFCSSEENDLNPKVLQLIRGENIKVRQGQNSWNYLLWSPGAACSLRG